MSDTVVQNWRCAYCLCWSSLTGDQYATEWIRISENAEHLQSLKVHVIICKNRKCRRATLSAELIGLVAQENNPNHKRQGTVRWFPLAPASNAKPQPSYVPSRIVADYQEACLIVALSPKVSATLSRRCLQGMIRDFFGVNGRTLFEEINSIKGRTPDDVWDAIDAVRKIGNIGAHMEKDIDVIVDVDEGEASLLLTLLEQLFDDWYVARYTRQERLAAIKNVASEKDERRKVGTGATTEATDG